MRNDITSNFTPNRIANQIRMRRNSHLGSFLIVECRDDKLFYERFVNNQECEFSIALGKENAIGALEILDRDNFQGVLAIVDADFDRLDNQLPSSLNLYFTDEHDLEMMLIKSPAFDKLIKERASEEKINSFNQEIRDRLLEVGKEIGYLRWVSLKENLSLKFEDLDFGKFLNKNNLKLDILKMIKTVKNNSQKPEIIEENLQKSLDILKNHNHDPWQVCCGHDLICILSIGLCKVWESWNSKEVQPDNLERELRLAYEELYFQKTHLYINIRQGEVNNSPYKVLK